MDKIYLIPPDPQLKVRTVLFSRVSAALTAAAEPHGRGYDVLMKRAIPVWIRKC